MTNIEIKGTYHRIDKIEDKDLTFIIDQMKYQSFGIYQELNNNKNIQNNGGVSTYYIREKLFILSRLCDQLDWEMDNNK